MWVSYFVCSEVRRLLEFVCPFTPYHFEEFLSIILSNTSLYHSHPSGILLTNSLNFSVVFYKPLGSVHSFFLFPFLFLKHNEFSPSVWSDLSFLLLTHSDTGTLPRDALISVMFLKHKWSLVLSFCLPYPFVAYLTSLIFFLHSIRFGHLCSLLILNIFLIVISKHLLGGWYISVSSGAGTAVLFLSFHYAMIPCFFVCLMMLGMVLMSLDLGV